MRAGTIVLLCAGCIDVDAYATRAETMLAPLALAVPAPAMIDSANRIHDPFLLADVDGDGRPDLVYGSEDKTISVHLGQGEARFGPRVVSGGEARGSLIIGLVAADLDGDGAMEVIVPQVDAWRWNPTSATLVPLDPFEQASTYDAVGVSGDFDGNGKAEVWYIGTTGVVVTEWDGAHLSEIAQTGDDLKGTSTSLVPVDADGDGQLDVLAFPANAANSGARIFWHGPQAWANSSVVTCGAEFQTAAIVDLDGDRIPDLVVDNGVAQVLWCRGHGDRSFDAPRLVTAVNGLGFLQGGDFDRDRQADLLWAARGGPDPIQLFRNFGGARFDHIDLGVEFPSFPPIDYTRNPRTMVFDLDGDRLDDVVVWNTDGLSWMRNVSK